LFVIDFEGINKRETPDARVAFQAVKIATETGVAQFQNIMFEQVNLNIGNG